MTTIQQIHSVYKVDLTESVYCTRTRSVALNSGVWNRFSLIPEEFFVYTTYVFADDGDVSFERRIVNGHITLYVYILPEISANPIVRTKNKDGEFVEPAIAPSRISDIWDAYRLSLIEPMRKNGKKIESFVSMLMDRNDDKKLETPKGMKILECGHLAPVITLVDDPCAACLGLEEEEEELRRDRIEYAQKALTPPTVALVEDAEDHLNQDIRSLFP